MAFEVTGEQLDEAAEHGRALLVELLEDGLTEDEALDLLASVADLLLPMRAILPPPFGSLAEAGDGPAIRAALAGAVEACKPNADNMERRAERAAARGHLLVAARRRRRATKIRNRRNRRN